MKNFLGKFNEITEDNYQDEFELDTIFEIKYQNE